MGIFQATQTGTPAAMSGGTRKPAGQNAAYMSGCDRTLAGRSNSLLVRLRLQRNGRLAATATKSFQVVAGGVREAVWLRLTPVVMCCGILWLLRLTMNMVSLNRPEISLQDVTTIPLCHVEAIIWRSFEV